GLAVLQQLGQHLRRHRLADQIALHLVTALITQERQLAVLLHPFGHHLQVHAVRHGDDGAHYGRVPGMFIQLVDEGAVDLQAVDGEVLEIGQRRVTGRSEEHTSELQSRENLVCRLLLEKKKIKNTNTANSRRPVKTYQPPLVTSCRRSKPSSLLLQNNSRMLPTSIITTA